MGKFISEMEGKAVLGFRRSQLLYDIENAAYIEGDVLERENYHTRQVIQDVGQRGNVDRVTRIMDLAVARCVERLYPFTKQEVEMPWLDDKFKEEPMYWIVMNLPENFSQTTLNYLEKLIHEFIVCRAVEDWLSLTNPAKSKIWQEKGEEHEKELLDNLKTRRGRVRRTLHPF